MSDHIDPTVIRNAERPADSMALRSDRIAGIDTARGIALLGIFFVNAAHFGLPMYSAGMAKAPVEEGLFGLVFYWFTYIFCTGKFFPLFSILFGAGLTVMYFSAQKSGGNFYGRYLMRLIVLALLGILHITFLWAGDILLVYAAIGLWMFLLVTLRPRSLLIIGSVVYVIGQLLLLGIFSLQMALTSQQATYVPKEMPAGENRIDQLTKVFMNWNQSEPFDSRLIELETQIFSQGPFWETVVMRWINYGMTTIAVAMFVFWVIFPCFCVGVALMKVGFFHGKTPRLRRAFLIMGLLIGLPMAIVGAISHQYPPNSWMSMVSNFALFEFGPVLSLCYLSLILNWVESGVAQRLAQVIGNLGKMALTGYLLETVGMSIIMLYWGFGRFGDTTWTERTLYLVGIYLLILLFANFWMKHFVMGPMEWIWRSITYWRWMPLRRMPARTPAATAGDS